jgi:hypothetical protein
LDIGKAQRQAKVKTKTNKIMAHKLEKRDSQYGIVMAWHNLTKIVPKITREIAFPWQVVLAPVLYQNGEKTVEHNGWRLPLASDDGLPLGFGVPVNCAGDNATYTLRTPFDTWNFVQQVTNGTLTTVVSAGTVQNRSKYFISTKLDELEDVKLEDGSKIELILNGLGSMDKSLHESIVYSGTRTVCYNTLMMNFLQKENAWKYRHSKNMAQKIENDKPLIEKAVGFSAIVKATFDSLIGKPCNVDRARNVYAGILAPDGAEELSKRSQNMLVEHVDCFRTGDGNSGKSEFDLLNGWTQPRTRGYSDSKKDDWSVYETSEFGSYSRSKEQFAAMLVNGRDELAKVEEIGARLVAKLV